MTSERRILRECLRTSCRLDTTVKEIQDRPIYENSVRNGEDTLGLFRLPSARKAVIADMDMLDAFQENDLEIPSFMEAGPRATLRFKPDDRAAIVTTGGLAPGLHCVIHSIVKRHCDIYGHNQIFGVYNSFKGLCNLANNLTPQSLTSKVTEDWLDQGGSQLGSVRYHHGGKKGDDALNAMADVISTNLQDNDIDVLYIIGGDGTLRAAHKIAERNPSRSIVGIPKTMDNDILWVWQSFGFDTAVEQATRIINTLRSEAEGTRRIGLVELFGAESGFVAANAALASGHVDAVLVPEVFEQLTSSQSERYLEDIIIHLEKRVHREAHNPHGVVVIAEGVGTYLEKNASSIDDTPIKKSSFVNQLKELIARRVRDPYHELMTSFVNQPRHYVRAVPANAHDQIYCERLGALAVDNALAGYTSFMISQWLTEFVLVPTSLVIEGKKSLPVNGMFWKQVVSSTGQPLAPTERSRESADLRQAIR